MTQCIIIKQILMINKGGNNMIKVELINKEEIKNFKYIVVFMILKKIKVN